VVVPEAEIAKFYNENPKSFTTREIMKAHHILIAFPKRRMTGRVEFPAAAAAEKAKLRARANNSQDAQAKDADFQKLACSTRMIPLPKATS
jgi:hypothetical protein